MFGRNIEHMDLKSTYNTIAEDWVKDHSNDTWWQEGTDTFLSFLPKGASILDVGCGAGVKTAYLSMKGYQATGVDFSEKMIEIAKRNLPGIEFNVLDMYELDTYRKVFDGVFAQASLLHIPKARVMEVLEKMKNTLHPGGCLYVAVKSSTDDGITEKVVRENDYGYEYERFFSFFSLAELRDYVKRLDMTMLWENNTDRSKAAWIQIIAKKK